jgi:hypothetical protein
MADLYKRLEDWYMLSERRKKTFGKLFMNNMMTHDQVLRMKQAKAAFEVIPLAVWTPFLFFLMPRSLYLSTT